MDIIEIPISFKIYYGINDLPMISHHDNILSESDFRVFYILKDLNDKNFFGSVPDYSTRFKLIK